MAIQGRKDQKQVVIKYYNIYYFVMKIERELGVDSDNKKGNEMSGL